MSLNQCQFIGNLGRDPEVRSFQNGNKVCNLRLAVSERWKDRNTGEQRERTEWVSVAIFSDGLIRVAEQYLRKGSKVYISGKMVTRKWQDQAGQDRYSTEIVLQGFDAKLVMLDGPQGTRGQSQENNGFGGRGGGYGTQGGYGAGGIDDEIPFAPEVRI
ncbi:single-stranded DNA-binding protein [Thalassobius sp. S69A]|uniref:single-stranded DNA-binding protein n=1 Tax=unclassified Thalassovita TaxID=2619711 RepID=UPI003C7E7EE8